MNIKKYIKNYKYLIILGLSLLSLLPIVFWIWNMEDLAKIADVKVVNEKLIKDTLSKNIDKFSIWFPFMIGLIVWIANSVLSALWLHKKQINAFYAYTSLILGGLGLHVFILVFLTFKKDAKKEKKENSKSSKVIAVAGISSLSALVVVPFVAVEVTKHPDSPSYADPIEVSLDENNPNLFEIFSDGFDRGMQREGIESDQNFKDFNFFNRFMTAGTNTHKSLPVLWGGRDYNYFNIMNEHNLNPSNAQSEVYGKYFLEAGIKHVYSGDFDQRTLGNTQNFSDNPGYFAVYSGTAHSVKEMHPDLNINNWSGARDSVYGKWGISNASADKACYEWMGNNIKISSNSKGARILTDDLITHRSFQLDANGNYSLHNFSDEDQQKNLTNIVSNLITKLKSVKKVINGKEISAYDNSMIVIYGDHSTHGLATNEGLKMNDDVRHAESLLMIKYPNKSYNKLNVVNDRYVYASELNGIISHYFNNRNEEPMDYFKNSKFDNKPRPVFFEDDRYVMVEWKDATNINSKLGQKIVPIGQPVIWSEKDKAQQAHDVTGLMEE